MSRQFAQSGFNAPAPEKQARSKKAKKHRNSSARRTSGQNDATASKGSVAQAGRQRSTQQEVIPHHSRGSITQDPQAQKRKLQKAQIKTLIEESQIDKHAGETVYRYVLGNRIRELHVNEQVHQQLIDETLSVTRLNGKTCIVPAAVVQAIRDINPDWAIMKPSSEDSSEIEGYEDFKVPDDLQW